MAEQAGLHGLHGLHGLLAQDCAGWVGLADVAGLDGLAKLMGRERCGGGRIWAGCQDGEVEYTSCCQDCQYKVHSRDWIAKMGKTII